MTSPNASGTVTPTDHVAAWLSDHQQRTGVVPARFQKSENPSQLNACYETPRYLIDITAWDHASCLDIIALNKATQKEDYVIVGQCADTACLTQRLECFWQWLTSHDEAKVI